MNSTFNDGLTLIFLFYNRLLASVTEIALSAAATDKKKKTNNQ